MIARRYKPVALQRNMSAFTLIEVMVALVIVSLGMLAVIQAVSQTANNTTYLREKSVAHWVAMNRLTELRLSPQSPSVGDNAGEVEMAGMRWRWRSHVAATDVPSMKRIDVSVIQAEGAGLSDENSIASITGFYGAAIAPPGTVSAQFNLPLNVAASESGVPNQSGQPTQPGSPSVPPSVPPTETPPAGTP